METNLTTLWVSLSRAYEIALLGDFSIRVVIDSDYTEGFDDYKRIKEYFKGVEFSTDGDMIVQIVKPKSYESKLIGETLPDIIERVETAKANKKPIKFSSTSCDTLLKTATDRLSLSINDRYKIIDISKVIAQLDGSEDVEPVHVAEAIHYVAFDGSLIDVESNCFTFGYGISIAKTDLDREDIISAIKYLELLL